MILSKKKKRDFSRPSDLLWQNFHCWVSRFSKVLDFYHLLHLHRKLNISRLGCILWFLLDTSLSTIIFHWTYMILISILRIINSYCLKPSTCRICRITRPHFCNIIYLADSLEHLTEYLTPKVSYQGQLEIEAYYCVV